MVLNSTSDTKQPSALYVFLIYPLVCCIIAIFFGNRALFVGYLFSLTILATIVTIKSRITVKLALLGFFILIVLTAAFAFKADSTYGRLLIYKVSINMLQANPWKGVGLGNFQNTYLLYQAKYFSGETFSQRELLLADNTYYAFNDYFELIVETAATGILLLIFYFYSFIAILLLMLKRLYIGSYNSEHVIAFINSIAIASAAFFTPIYNSILWFSVLLISILSIVNSLIKNNKLILIGALSLVLFKLSASNWDKITKHGAYIAYKKADLLARAGFRQESLRIYAKTYPRLNTSPYFLFSYGRQLYFNGNFAAAIKMLEKARTKYPYNELYIDLGNAYQAQNRLAIAEYCYVQAVHMVPNRFYSRFKLFEFYIKQEQTDKAIICGEEILKMPVKIPSLRVDYIKESVKRMLKPLKAYEQVRASASNG